MMRAILKKLASKSGESLGETAASLLVVSMAMLMLAGSIVTSGQLNKEADDTVALAAVVGESDKPVPGSVTLSYEGAAPTTVSVGFYDAGGLYYYEPQDKGSSS